LERDPPLLSSYELRLAGVKFMEHRWGTRIPVDIPVRLVAPRWTALEGQVVNLSSTGALITIGHRVRLLSRLDVLILPAHAQTVVVPAYVIRQGNEGIGVEWCDYAPRAICELLRTRTLASQKRDIENVSVAA
jgi:hypothetical protein